MLSIATLQGLARHHNGRRTEPMGSFQAVRLQVTSNAMSLSTHPPHHSRRLYSSSPGARCRLVCADLRVHARGASQCPTYRLHARSRKLYAKRGRRGHLDILERPRSRLSSGKVKESNSHFTENNILPSPLLPGTVLNRSGTMLVGMANRVRHRPAITTHGTLLARTCSPSSTRYRKQIVAIGTRTTSSSSAERAWELEPLSTP